RATAFSYVQIVYSILLGLVFFNELPSMWTYLGGAVIVLGALVNMFGGRYYQHKLAKKL
ncbi:MAG: EamA/RhaT family transporter, partial [Vibrio sp.]